MITESRLELAFSGRTPVIVDETTMTLLHIGVTTTTITVIVHCWWILARHRDMVGLVYLIACNLHMVLLMASETAIILHNISVSA
jgi:hypothetical protein